MLRLSNYWQRINRYPLIPLYLGKVFQRGELESQLVEEITAQLEKALKSVFSDYHIWTHSKVSPEETSAIFKSEIERGKLLAKKAIEEYLPILRNQALVLTCTVFDDCMYEVLKIITDLRPEVLKNLSKKDDITAFDVIELQEYSKVLGQIQSRVLDRFSFAKPVSNRINTFGSIGIDTGSLYKLDSRSAEIQREYPNGEKLLNEIYETRNDIIHRDILAIKSDDELAKRTSFLNHLLTELCFQVSRKFRIPIDIEETIKDAVKGAER